MSFASNLEAQVFNALLNPQAVVPNAGLILETQQIVETTIAASQETVSLIQLAYGGQSNKFTDNYKSDLAEQIYYAPVPATDVYENFRQFDWQRTIENFAPMVGNLAEQYNFVINPPAGENERNKLLTDFVSQQLIASYESKNDPLEKYIKDDITKIAAKTANMDILQTQKDTIAGSINQNLNPPDFSTGLEAFAYSINKMDDDKKAAKVSDLADYSKKRAAAALRREEKEIFMQEERGLTME